MVIALLHTILITNVINTILALSNKVAKKEDFKNLQNIAFDSLKKNLIKKTEIDKYKIENYNQTDVNNYIKKFRKQYWFTKYKFGRPF